MRGFKINTNIVNTFIDILFRFSMLYFTIKAESLEEAKKKLHKEAFRLEFSTASKLVQDILISIDGEWIPA